MEGAGKKKITNVKVVMMVVLMVVVLIVIFALVSVILREKKVNLYNIDQIDSGLSAGEIQDLEDFIWQSLRDSQGLDDSKAGIIALVRPSSYTWAEEDGVRSYEFLMDIDEFKATYEVSFALMGGQGFYESPNINCPVPELMKYPETYCQSEKTSTMSVTIGSMLPYYLDVGGGEIVMISLARDDDASEYLTVKASSCGDQAVLDNVRKKVELWIKSVGYDPGKYDIRIPEYCDGGGR